jgi:hypothetical protein
MIAQRDAIVILDRMIERSRELFGTPEVRHYGPAILMVRATADETVYVWGANEVDRRVALNAVATFTDSSR